MTVEECWVDFKDLIEARLMQREGHTDRLEDIIIKLETIAAKLEKLRSHKGAGDDNLLHVY